MSARELLTIIDEDKENISSGLYVKLCDALLAKKKQENEIKEQEENFYSVKYSYPMLENEDGMIFITMYKETEIVKLKTVFVEDFIKDHMKDGTHIDNIRNNCCGVNISKHLSRYGSMLSVSHLVRTPSTECTECDEIIEGDKILENVQYMTPIIILNIEKAHLINPIVQPPVTPPLPEYRSVPIINFEFSN